MKAFIQTKLNELHVLTAWLEVNEPSELEKKEAGMAIDYLRKLGKTESEIRGWLLTQRVRAQFLSTFDP